MRIIILHALLCSGLITVGQTPKDTGQLANKLDSTRAIIDSLYGKIDTIKPSPKKDTIKPIPPKSGTYSSGNIPEHLKYKPSISSGTSGDSVSANLPILSGYPSGQHYYKWENDTFNPYKFEPKEFYQSYNLQLVDSAHPVFVFPLDNDLDITSKFGWRRYRYHHGIDLNLETGEPVRSCWDGRVRFAKFYAGYGNVVVVRHYNGLETVYAHLDAITCRLNEEVKAGTIIGLGGNTGRSTGSHLHLEFRYRGKSIDPTKIIQFKTKSMWSTNYILSQSSFGHHIEITSVKYHTIRKGDTLSGIAKRHKTTVSRLCSLNRISRNTTLRIGKRLRVR